jgi:DNA-binding SARP family transcriptional activator/predicted ATPase
VPRLALYLLGSPRIERDGVAIKLDRRKAMALLAYLAITERSHRRDSLVNLLWPDLGSAEGRAALRRTLHALTSALGSGRLAADRDEIGLMPGAGLWVDVLRFRQSLAACAGHGHPASQTCPACVPLLAEAVSLFRGDLLTGFGLKDSLNFDDWQLLQAEALRQELADALDRLVLWHSTQREFEPALAYARRRLALDPLDEAAHRQLMCLYTWSGRRSAALRQYEECLALLADQLGVPPQDATRQLYEEIQAGDAPPLPAAPDSVPELPPFLREDRAADRPLFVARNAELAQLHAYLDAALNGRGQVVFVTGDPGSGKTALIQEFSRRAQEAYPGPPDASPPPGQALVVASGNCNAYTGMGDPYLPFREILELLTGDVEARWAAGAMTTEHARRLWHMLPLAARALVEAGPDLIDTFVSRAALLERARICVTDRPGWLSSLEQREERRPAGLDFQGLQQGDLLMQYTRVVQALAHQIPLLLVVDDLQWADPGSVSLLFHLGRHLAGNRILIVGAYRPEEVSAGRDGQRHPLEPLVNEFQRISGDVTVNLDRAESRDFLEAFLDSEPNCLGPSFREMLYRQTRAHPLFTVELLRGLQERGDLVQDAAGQWVEGEALDWQMLPARVEAAIRERIGRLPESLQAALQVASVEGEVFTAEAVARVLDTDEREMVQRLSSELDRRHRLVRAEAIQRLDSRRVSRYRFRNYLFQKYVYDSLDQVERAYLHEAVGNVLEALYAEQAGDSAVELAWHFQKAGLAQKAIHYLHQAGKKAARLSAYEEALGHLSAGLALLDGLPDPQERTRQELELRLALGYASLALGTFTPEAEAAHDRTRQLGQQMGQAAQLCEALNEMATFHYVKAEYLRARELAEEALSQARRAADPELVAWSHWHLGFVLFGLGEFVMAEDHLEQAIAYHAGEIGLQPAHAFPIADAGLSSLAYAACCLWCLGYPEQAAKRSHEALTLARQLKHPLSLADVLCYGGCLFHTMRRDVSGLKLCAEELMQLATDRIPSWLEEALWFMGDALATLGQLPEGIALIQQGIALHRHTAKGCYVSGALASLAAAQAKAGVPEQGLATLAEALSFVAETDERHWEAELHRIRAELLLLVGDEPEAERSLRQAIEVARRQSARSWELRATTSLARLWQAQGRAREAREMLGEIYRWFTEGFDSPDLVQARALWEELL